MALGATAHTIDSLLSKSGMRIVYRRKSDVSNSEDDTDEESSVNPPSPTKADRPLDRSSSKALKVGPMRKPTGSLKLILSDFHPQKLD